MRWLPDCLCSLAAQTYRDFEVLLVDNGSTDQSVGWVSEHYPAVRLIRSSRNLGFAAANNAAIRASCSDWVATLNNDTRVLPDWLGALVEAAEQSAGVAAQTGQRGIGMVASCMLLWDQPLLLDSAGIRVDKAGIGWNRYWDEPAGRAQIQDEVLGPCAGAALYRRAMLDEVGLFDEDFFAYYEDVDLAWRAQWAGWRCIYAPAAQVYHAHSATGGQASAFKAYHLARNRIWTWLKNYPLPQLLPMTPIILAYDLLSLAAAIMNGQGRAALVGRAAALRGLPAMVSKRQRMARRLPASGMMKMLEPAENPFAILRRRGNDLRR
jgi:GT2 family glycosyltransferase